MTYAVFSWGMMRKKLGGFFPESSVSLYIPFKKYNFFLGWGRKKSFRRAKKLGYFLRVPVLSIEDGFLRSLGTPRNTPDSLSLMVDDCGIYYDARTASRLEKLIISPSENAEILERARQGIAFLRQHHLTKYNQAPLLSPYELGITKPYVLLIDQTYGDASVAGGLADEHSFQEMLSDALRDNPHHEIVIKTHPEVVTGEKQGYFDIGTLPKNVRLIGGDCNPWPLLEGAQKVYTVTSQMGFEALMVGVEVHCYGMPFYAGWGLTQDQMTCSRRTLKRSLEHLFAALYFDYTRYINPFTRTLATFEETAELLSEWIKIAWENQKIASVTGGYFFWKEKQIRQFFWAPGHDIYVGKNIQKALKIAKKIGKKVAFWSGKIDPTTVSHLTQTDFVRIEDGFIRSVGLGANLVAPQSIVVDSRGIYFDPTQPSDLEVALNAVRIDAKQESRARKLIQKINDTRISKYNGSDASKQPPVYPIRGALLVVGQVEDDASIRLGTRKISTNLGLLKEVRKRHPHGYILYKPHPDVLSGHRTGAIDPQDMKQLADRVLENVSLPDALDMCDQIHTMTSLVGFEGLLRGKEVHCYGLPFYAGWGLTRDHYVISRRKRQLTLEELVWVSLIDYPRYVDPQTGLWCSPEVLIERLNALKNKRNFSVRILLRRLWGRVKLRVYG